MQQRAAKLLHGDVYKRQVVDLADRILPSILDVRAGEIMQKHIEDKGTKFKMCIRDRGCVCFVGSASCRAFGHTRPASVPG